MLMQTAKSLTIKTPRTKKRMLILYINIRKGQYTNTKQIYAERHSYHSQIIWKNWPSHEQENIHRTPEKLLSYIGIDHLVRVSKTMMTGTSVCFTMEPLWNSYPLLASSEHFQKSLFHIKSFHFTSQEMTTRRNLSEKNAHCNQIRVLFFVRYWLFLSHPSLLLRP